MRTDTLSQDPSDVAEAQEAGRCKLSDGDIRHNMKCVIALDAIFTTGVADLSMATTPLWVFLGASSTRIGLLNSLGILALLGIVVSPFLSVRFSYKKWYLFVVHLPYIGTWGVMGAVLLLSKKLGLSDAWLLGFLTVMVGANNFFAGFVPLPHQEYTAACIPMSHRARYSGYSQSIGSISSLGSTAVGYWILQTVIKPLAWGYLYLMAWFFCQAGYVLALFGREFPTPVQNAPKPWSKAMLKSVWLDRPFLKLMLLHALYVVILYPVVNVFIQNYGYAELKMAPKLAAVIMMILNVVRIAVSGPVGYFTDRLHPKKMMPYWPLVACLSIVPVLLLRNTWGVYISTAIGGVFMFGQGCAFLALIYGLPKPENRSGHYTVQIIESFVAGSIGPIMMGAMCDLLTFRVTFAMVAAASVALCPISFWLLKGISAESKDYA